MLRGFDTDSREHLINASFFHPWYCFGFLELTVGRGNAFEVYKSLTNNKKMLRGFDNSSRYS